MKLLSKSAWVVFTAGPTHAPRMYEEASALIRSFDANVCPHVLPDRAVYRHSSAAGQTVLEAEPDGKAALEIAQLHTWTCAHVRKSTFTHVGTVAR